MILNKFRALLKWFWLFFLDRRNPDKLRSYKKDKKDDRFIMEKNITPSRAKPAAEVMPDWRAVNITERRILAGTLTQAELDADHRAARELTHSLSPMEIEEDPLPNYKAINKFADELIRHSRLHPPKFRL